jgi:ATP-binding cassette subfamily F protein 3
VITLKDVDFAYKSADGTGELVVYRGLNLEVERHQRTVLVGPNGAGKSTLIKLLAGNLEVQRGERIVGHNVRVGYFAQQRVEQLNLRQTVLEAAQDLPSRPGEQISRTVLGSFLFRGDDVFKPVAVLSGGEKSRLALARLLLDPPNLMLLDEPTTHLDIPSIDALIGALEQYEGTVIFISHDVHFIRRVASTVLHISAGQLTPYAGDYQYYLDKTRATSAKEALVAGEQLHDFQPAAAAEVKQRGPGLKEIKERERAAANERKAAAQVKRDREKRVAELEQSIATMEGRQRDLTQLLQNPIVHLPGGTAPDLSRELTALARKLYEANIEWERESALLEQPAQAR